MRKFYLLFMSAAIALFSQAQPAAASLNSQPIGSAGNLLSVIQVECNQLDANDSLKVVTFIHRVDNTIPALQNSNIGQFAYDESKDGGNTWTSNIGSITNNDSINNFTISGRYPQAVIYNKPGNTITDSALLVYSEPWHNSPPTGTTGSWQGQLRGRGGLSEDASTYDDYIDQINGGQVSIATGMCRGASGTFWNLNENFTGTFASGSAQIDVGLIVQKGVWNPVTRDVDWTNKYISQSFDSSVNTAGSPQNNYSVASAFNMAFDPTGKYGWIVCLGNIDPNTTDSASVPIFWMSTDSGTTWSGPIVVDLDSISGVDQNLGPFLLGNPGLSNINASAPFDDALTVDVYGNPHLLTTVCIGGGQFDYYYQYSGFDMWDITFNANATSSGCNWQGIHLAKIFSIEGNQASSSQDPGAFYSGENRPLISRSPDGHKIFFFWETSDTTWVTNYENTSPNLFGVGIDVVSNKITQVVNFTAGDSLWGGGTSNFQPGVFQLGATFPVIGQTCLVQGNNYNIPLVLTQIDYPCYVSGGNSCTDGDQPAQFWYVNNINFSESDFTLPEGPAPAITLIGSDTENVYVNTSYIDSGATAFDCRYGNIPVTAINPVDSAVLGTYYELYIATDSAGNTDTAVRVIMVVGPPMASFNWITNITPYTVQFEDQSTGSPTSWSWNFGNNSGSTLQNPSETFASIDSSYDVCLIATNSYGSSPQFCRQVGVSSASGITPVQEFSEQVNLFPNPSGGKVSILLSTNSLPDFTVSTYDVLGNLVAGPAEYQAGTRNAQIDLSALSNGVYVVKIQSSLGPAVKNAIITHNK